MTNLCLIYEFCSFPQTNEFFKDYEPGKIEASAKTFVFFCMLDEIIRLGDRLLLFSQSLFTLDLIEDFLHLYNIPNTEEKWARNKNYFRKYFFDSTV